MRKNFCNKTDIGILAYYLPNAKKTEKMNLITKITVLGAALLMTFSCKNYYDSLRKSTDVDYKYKGAFDFYNKGKFKKAADLFEELILVSQGTPREDTVQFYTALSNYKYGDYSTAESGFDKFVQVFPRSPFAEDAQYLRIICLYEGTFRYELDQVPTKKAIVVIREFMLENHESPYYSLCQRYVDELSERLDKKSYEAAKLYYKMEDYKAANFSLKSILKENSNNIYREDILYYAALASYKFAQNSIPEKQKERFLSFIDDYYNFVGEFPKSTYKNELEELYNKVQKNLKKDKQSKNDTTNDNNGENGK
jgi:outer membrane protein assembly factor BamD